MAAEVRREDTMSRCSVRLSELETNLHKVFTITERAPTRAFSWLKAPEHSGPVHLHHRAEVLRILELFVDLCFQL